MSSESLFKTSKFFLYLVPFAAIIVYQGSLFPFIVGKYVFFRTAVELALVFSVWGWAMDSSKSKNQNLKLRDRNQDCDRDFWRPIKTPLAVAVTAFVAIYVISGFFGINPSASFWSNFERGEGGLQILHLFIFFALAVVLLRDSFSWKRMLFMSIIAATLVVSYGVFAAFKYVDATADPGGSITGGGDWYNTFRDFIGGDLCARFSGSLGNPAYVGTYMIFAIFWSSLLSIRAKGRMKWVWLGFVAIFLAVLLFTQTRGAFLGLGAGIGAALLYLVFAANKTMHRTGAGAVFLILILAGIYAVKNPSTVNIAPYCKNKGQVLDISFKGETFQTRLVLWRKAVEAFKERPVLGWGPENFSMAIEKHFDTRLSEAWFDRAHNIFFDYLVFSGALGLFAFIGVFLVFYWEFIKRFFIKKKLRGKELNASGRMPGEVSVWERALFFGLPAAYLVQGFVLFDVLPTYINLFLFLALAVYIFRDSGQNFKSQ